MNIIKLLTRAFVVYVWVVALHYAMFAQTLPDAPSATPVYLKGDAQIKIDSYNVIKPTSGI